MKNQTAVEWLQLQINNKDMGEIPMWVYELIDQALAMEKAQMEELKDFEKWKEWKNEPQ